VGTPNACGVCAAWREEQGMYIGIGTLLIIIIILLIVL
jgi:hypothetical protein